MKNLYVLCAIFFSLTTLISTTPASAQGWIGNGGNILYARNSSLQLSPLNIGIGTNTPTAQLHTTGSVRFAGLTNSNQSRVLVSDANGNLYYRDISTIGSSGWLLSGNAASSTNFIGTTNAQDFRIRTNNVQRMVVSSTGNVGINNTTPNYKLSISGNENGQGSYDGRTFIRLQNLSTANTSAVAISLAAGSDQSLYGGLSYAAPTYTVQADLAKSLHLFANGNGVEVSSLSSTGSVRFATNVTTGNESIERMRITSNGYVGINTKNPTATLHTNGTVRFENLPSGSGAALVIDANGNIYKSNLSARKSDSGNNDEIKNLKNTVVKLQNEIDQLTASVAMLKMSGKMIGVSDGARLYQNAPNPFSASTKIRYYIPKDVSDAECVIYDMHGIEQRRTK